MYWVSCGMQIGGRLSWSRNYAAEDYNLVIRGVEEIADAVGVTMGPKGRNVVIEQSYGSPKVRKGVIVAGSIKFKDKFKGIGSSLVRSIAYLVNGVARDGCKSLEAGMNEKDLQHGIHMAVNAVVTNLKSRARMISTSEEIAQVGTTSANGEREIGELIAKAMEKVGKEGAITIAAGKTLYNELEVVKGMKLEYSDYRCRYFITNLKRHQRFCGIPGFGENRKASLQDLAVLTGGNLITEELGMNLENVDLDMLGSCKKAIITDHDTVVIDGAGDKEALEERCEQIRLAIDLSTSDYDKEKLQERLAKLSGGVAVLKIGGASEAEVGEKKDRVTDALIATKAALEEGIVPDMVKAGIIDPLKVMRTALREASSVQMPTKDIWR
ncbi:hypothetical protein LOK49_LG08G02499 [Camellia lanceoleosa]|uniref:Uncharacterized protein n=1 Tax=Camellia lanceoleosa TaxID=1840588 RepID=A0ACC0GMM7_9ERIC|nr:hypothetical protein LOK49_LG08G02499 [Camellia lanceoleosa]